MIYRTLETIQKRIITITVLIVTYFFYDYGSSYLNYRNLTKVETAKSQKEYIKKLLSSSYSKHFLSKLNSNLLFLIKRHKKLASLIIKIL